MAKWSMSHCSCGVDFVLGINSENLVMEVDQVPVFAIDWDVFFNLHAARKSIQSIILFNFL
jgi:hypothetical protein